MSDKTNSLTKSIDKDLRHACIKDAFFAKQHYAKLNFDARRLIGSNDVINGVKAIHQAYQIADLLLDIDSDHERAERRFAKTTAELAYTFRLLGHYKSLMQLINKVELRAKQHARFHSAQQMTQELMFVADCHDECVDEWHQRMKNNMQASQHFATAKQSIHASGLNQNKRYRSS